MKYMPLRHYYETTNCLVESVSLALKHNS